tara:strand:- start:321 stop:665 length:345 start_codon:yes stop_codon:yes gene_type:complete
MKKIKVKMNENEKVEFVMSYCDQLVHEALISQQDYLVFKKELRASLEASHSIPNHKSHSFSFKVSSNRVAVGRIGGLQKIKGLKKTKLSRATLSQLKMFANYEINKFLGQENRV